MEGTISGLVMKTIIWHGSTAEGRELVTAISHNCTCASAAFGMQPSRVCDTHDAFVHDQAFVDRLVFYRRERQKLLAEEGLIATGPIFRDD